MEDKTQQNSAALLQKIVEEEREKRVKAEQYAQALVEEFTACNDFEAVRQKFRDKVKEFAPQALINIITMANGAESEAVRANLNKWVIEWAMSDRITGEDSGIRQLLEELKKAPSAETTST